MKSFKSQPYKKALEAQIKTQKGCPKHRDKHLTHIALTE